MHSLCPTDRANKVLVFPCLSCILPPPLRVLCVECLCCLVAVLLGLVYDCLRCWTLMVWQVGFWIYLAKCGFLVSCAWILCFIMLLLFLLHFKVLCWCEFCNFVVMCGRDLGLLHIWVCFICAFVEVVLSWPWSSFLIPRLSYHGSSQLNFLVANIG